MSHEPSQMRKAGLTMFDYIVIIVFIVVLAIIAFIYMRRRIIYQPEIRISRRIDTGQQ